MRQNPARVPSKTTGLVVVPPHEDDAWTLVLINTHDASIMGWISVFPPVECGRDTAIVGGAGAVKGWGPVLYDQALDLAAQHDWWLAPDRRSISEAALPIWTFYENKRADVESEPVDRTFFCGVYHVPELDRRYRPTWDVPSPMFEQLEKAGDDWVDARAKATDHSPEDVRIDTDRRGFRQFQVVYDRLREAGMGKESAFSYFDILYMGGVAAWAGAALRLLPNPGPRSTALKRRLLRT